MSDHALDVVLYADADEATLDGILARRLSGATLSEHEVAQFKTAVLVWLGAEYARRGWVQQYHIGALRNNNLRQFNLLGRTWASIPSTTARWRRNCPVCSANRMKKTCCRNHPVLPEPA